MEILEVKKEDIDSLFLQANKALSLIKTLPKTWSINQERYFTGEEIQNRFSISPRTLQDYRDNRTIPYTRLGGKILYPESEILKILERNLVRPLK